MSARAMLALVCVPGAVAFAGPAHGDPLDIDFLTSLRAAGITYNGAGQVITIAQKVCRLMEGGKPAPEIVTELIAQNPGLEPDRGEQFIAMATRSYCPEQLAQPGVASADSPGL